MFGGGSHAAASKPESPTISESPESDHNASSAGRNTNGNGSRKKSPSPDSGSGSTSPLAVRKSPDNAGSGEKRSGNGSPPGRQDTGSTEKKRRSSGVGSKASSLIASAKNSLNFSQGNRSNNDVNQSPLQKLGKQDQSLAVPQGQHNNSAGDSFPGARSTFRVGVWEDRNKKCRRTMEDTHAFLYNFLHTPAPLLTADSSSQSAKSLKSSEVGTAAAESRSDSLGSQEMVETDNGYFAIFDGHAGTFAADWCGKKVHLILEDVIKRNPNVPIPELLDQTFTTVDAQLEKLPLKNSGCTAAVAVLRWEDRVPSANSATGSQAIAPAAVAASKSLEPSKSKDGKADDDGNNNMAVPESAHARLKGAAQRQRVLYTANVGDARIILCRSGKALRLSYDHKGSDDNEGKRITNAGGLIMNNRVNGVLAVTRALGDTYIKDLVTGHPYTTETVVQPELDEFVIIACDGLWDVCSDQEAVDLVREIHDPVVAAKFLVDHALSRFSTDNLSCMIVRFDKTALMKSQNAKDGSIGVEGDAAETGGRISEAEKIVNSTRQKIAEGDTTSVGISASNSGKGHDPAPIEDGEGFKKTTLDGPVEEEPAAIDESDSDSPDATTPGPAEAKPAQTSETSKSGDIKS